MGQVRSDTSYCILCLLCHVEASCEEEIMFHLQTFFICTGWHSNHCFLVIKKEGPPVYFLVCCLSGLKYLPKLLAPPSSFVQNRNIVEAKQYNYVKHRFYLHPPNLCSSRLFLFSLSSQSCKRKTSSQTNQSFFTEKLREIWLKTEGIIEFRRH